MTTTLHAAAWAICETSGPRCEELCPGCLEQAKAAGRVWLEEAAQVAEALPSVTTTREEGEFLGRNAVWTHARHTGPAQAAAAIRALKEMPTA